MIARVFAPTMQTELYSSFLVSTFSRVYLFNDKTLCVQLRARQRGELLSRCSTVTLPMDLISQWYSGDILQHGRPHR